MNCTFVVLSNRIAMKDIQLRAIEPDDIDIIYTWENDQTIWESSDTHTPFSRYMLEQYIISAQSVDIQSSKQLRLIIDMNINGKMVAVGCVDIFDYDVFHHRAGIGILIDKNHRGRGLASEAINKVCNYCRIHLNMHSIYANIRHDNIASIKAFEKNGFELIGIKKDWTLTPMGYCNECMMQKILE